MIYNLNENDRIGTVKSSKDSKSNYLEIYMNPEKTGKNIPFIVVKTSSGKVSTVRLDKNIYFETEDYFTDDTSKLSDKQALALEFFMNTERSGDNINGWKSCVLFWNLHCEAENKINTANVSQPDYRKLNEN